jgi:hypothetical protein
MSRLDIDKVHLNNNIGDNEESFISRRYTLTHSDITGELFLSISIDYDSRVLSNWYTKLMRDEVLAEWQENRDGQCLMIFCHISGGICLGWAGLRNKIFRRELPLAIEAICNGDINFIANNPRLKEAKVIVNFNATKKEYNKTEHWGRVKDYILERFV